jgi:glycerol-3-phosphate cytidylyltransferase
MTDHLKTVLTFGVYDMMHIGHILLFKRAKERGDRLVVAVQADDSILKYKPEAHTVYPEDERCYMVAAIRYVDEVVIYHDVDRLVEEADFDLFVMGGDQNHAGFRRAADWCHAHGKETAVLSRTEGISTSGLKAAIKG